MPIRPLQPADLQQVCDLEKACFATPWSRKLFEEELAREDTCRWLVDERDGRVAAYMGWWKIGDEAHVTNLAVDPARRREGLGKQMVCAVLEQALAQGCTRATLEVRPSNEAAVKLYESLGFTAAAMRPGYYSDNGEDALIMWKENLSS